MPSLPRLPPPAAHSLVDEEQSITKLAQTLGEQEGACKQEAYKECSSQRYEDRGRNRASKGGGVWWIRGVGQDREHESKERVQNKVGYDCQTGKLWLKFIICSKLAP